MNRLLATRAIMILTGSLLLSNPISAQFIPSAKKTAHVRIVKGPELESTRENTTIITWTSNNPGGSPEHFAVVHYGTDPKNLSQTAKSHIRLNQGHRYTIFRVRIDDLQPKTTYYYKVDSMGANGRSDGVISTVKNFMTQ
jgi:asparagine N-glycosylation enzyme membrane subunit Stt3